jgi:GT2 family glycosyltransferase
MGRLHHLKETLPRNIADNQDYPNVQFVILDYNSPDGLEEWIHSEMAEYVDSGTIKFVQTKEPSVFHFAKAKNIVHRAADGEILCNLDADNLTNPGFASYMNDIFSENPMCIGTTLLYGDTCKGGTEGRNYIHRDNFNLLQGYDESFIGYGCEDSDFLHRAIRAGLTVVPIPQRYVDCIKHSMSEREKNLPLTLKEGVFENYKRMRSNMQRELERAALDIDCPLQRH